MGAFNQNQIITLAFYSDKLKQPFPGLKTFLDPRHFKGGIREMGAIRSLAAVQHLNGTLWQSRPIGNFQPLDGLDVPESTKVRRFKFHASPHSSIRKSSEYPVFPQVTTERVEHAGSEFIGIVTLEIGMDQALIGDTNGAKEGLN